MQFLLPIDIPSLQPRIAHDSKLWLIGSCFTEHMTHFLAKAKFAVKQNSHGILFNPLSVCKAVEDVIHRKQYTEKDLFFLNEYWHSWYHHSDFSFRNQQETLQAINEQIQTHHAFLREADYIFITLGSAFAYHHIEQQIYVSNNHRAPSQWFRKDLLEIDTIKLHLNQMLDSLQAFNPKLRVVFTISPVRHVRDGVIDNNRSKARLLEAIHSLEDTYYFPAYELVVDVLRDYRFYDLDMVHPNYQATAYVWEQFVQHCIDPNCLPRMKQLEQLHKARNHRPKDIGSEAHKRFLADHYQLCLELKSKYDYLDLDDEMRYFSEKV